MQTRLIALVGLITLTAGCVYQSDGLDDVRCNREGIIDSGRVCQAGVWVALDSGLVTPDAAADVTPDAPLAQSGRSSEVTQASASGEASGVSEASGSGPASGVGSSSMRRISSGGSSEVGPAHPIESVKATSIGKEFFVMSLSSLFRFARAFQT